jgi:hypothetical protein
MIAEGKINYVKGKIFIGILEMDILIMVNRT